MKFTINKGVNPLGETIPVERRGTIIDNRTKEQKDASYDLTLKSPRVMGKKKEKSK